MALIGGAAPPSWLVEVEVVASEAASEAAAGGKNSVIFFLLLVTFQSPAVRLRLRTTLSSVLDELELLEG